MSENNELTATEELASMSIIELILEFEENTSKYENTGSIPEGWVVGFIQDLRFKVAQIDKENAELEEASKQVIESRGCVSFISKLNVLEELVNQSKTNSNGDKD